MLKTAFLQYSNGIARDSHPTSLFIPGAVNIPVPGPPHETFMTDFSIRATAKNVNKKRIKGAKVAAFSFFRRLMGCKTDFDRLSFQKACCPFSIFRTGDIAKKKVRL